MRAEEIRKMIDKKGHVAREIFNALFYKYYNSPDLCWDEDYIYDEDVISTLHYNITILFMEKIRDNPSFYKERFYLSERNISRMEKDLKTMSRIDYPEEYNYMDFNNLEQFMTKSL